MLWRRLFTLLSFATMIGASVWVVSDHWPSGGMPWLAWPAHVAAMLIVVGEVLTRALKIQWSASAIGAPLRFGTALRVCLAGDFAAGVTPARSGAEPARFLVLGEAGLTSSHRLLVLFLELFLEMCSLALVCSALAVLFRGRGTSVNGLLALVGGYSVAVLGLGAAGWLLSRHSAHGPPPVWLRRTAQRVGSADRVFLGAWRALQQQLRQLRASVGALVRASRVRMLAALMASIVHVIGKVAVLPALVFLGGSAANDLPLNMSTLAPLVLWPLALFYGGVVVPAPGGGGAIEGAFAYTLGDAIPAGMFAAALLWWRFYTYYAYLLVGGFAAGETVRRALRRRAGHAARSARTPVSSS